jgi:PAS domain S-box-containing protein
MRRQNDDMDKPRWHCHPGSGLSCAAVPAAAVAIFLLSMATIALWSFQVQSASCQRDRADQLKCVGSLLVRSAETLMAGDELSAIRRIVLDAGVNHKLTQCRILLPDGQVIADANPSQITPKSLPESWIGPATTSESRITHEQISLTFPLGVHGRGNARLEIAGQVDYAAADNSMLSCIGGVAVAGLGLLLILYRHVLVRSRGIEGIRFALSEYQKGRLPLSALEVNDKWGREAKSWNELVRKEGSQHTQGVLEKAIEVLQSRRGASVALDAACDAMSQGLILVDENLRAQYVNGAAAMLLQTCREDLLMTDVTTFISDTRVIDALRAAATSPGRGRTIVEVQRDKLPESGVLRFVVRPVRRDDQGVVMIIVEDITQQKTAEQARNTFVARATHELRTPLTNIRLYVETALDDGDKDPVVRRESLNIVNEEVRRLDRMVGDILSVSEIEAGAMKLKKDDVRLDDLFHELQVDFAASAKEKDIDLTFKLPPKLPVIHGDRNKIALGLHNLIGNAVKYTPSGGQVAVNVEATEHQVVTEVTDTGIGISEADCQKVFEKFYRAKDKRLADITGSGLGLAIAREVIRLHGGDITVQSELDKGSTFTLVLPITGEAA